MAAGNSAGRWLARKQVVKIHEPKEVNDTQRAIDGSLG